MLSALVLGAWRSLSSWIICRVWGGVVFFRDLRGGGVGGSGIQGEEGSGVQGFKGRRGRGFRDSRGGGGRGWVVNELREGGVYVRVCVGGDAQWRAEGEGSVCVCVCVCVGGGGTQWKVVEWLMV